jgi:hypothetical protein
MVHVFEKLSLMVDIRPKTASFPQPDVSTTAEANAMFR